MRKKLSTIAISTLSALALAPAWAGNETGSNTWYGSEAAFSLTTGTSNSLFGTYAGYTITSGSKNVAVGYFAGSSGPGGVGGNTAIGYGSGYSNPGDLNVFLGHSAGLGSSGSNRLFIDNCFYYDTGICNKPFIYGEFDTRLLVLDGVLGVSNKSTGVGRSQLHFSHAGTDVGGWLTSVGDNNFFMSSGARFEAGSWIQRAPDGNAVIAGSSGTGYKIFTSTGVGVGGVASGLLTRFHVDYSGQIGLNTYVVPGIAIATGTGAYLSAGGVWTNASSRALKEDIRKLSAKDAQRALDALEPVSFRYKATDGESHVGFIAEDVPELVATKDRKGVSSMDVVAVLTRIVKEQQAQIAELATEVRRMREAR
jgi:hypothetical protein